ncbi:hypothetical protein O1L44_23210 [Streptomyces noursei]|nr:hypothetical protein [Streptomyces noursei]
MLLVSELVTNAVVHAGTTVDVLCRLDPAEEPVPHPDEPRTPFPRNRPAPAWSSRSPTGTPPSRSGPARTPGPTKAAATGSG